MKPRRLLLLVHLGIGIVASPILCFLGLTGAILAFERPLDDALNRELSRVTPGTRPLPLADLVDRAGNAFPGRRMLAIGLAGAPDETVAVTFELPEGGRGVAFVDPYTGRVAGTDAAVNPLLGRIHQLHKRLLGGELGSALVGWGGVALIVLGVTGLILWWPAKRLRLRPGQRLVGLHHAAGALVWPALIAFGATGAAEHWGPQVQRLLAAVTSAPPMPAPPPPGDACADRPLRDPDQLVAIAVAAIPDATPTSLQVGPRGSVRVVMRDPSDHTPLGRSGVFMEGCTGKVVKALDVRTTPLAYRLTRQWNRELHTGDLLGWPSRVAAALFSLALPLLALTGPLMWWMRRRRRARRRA